MKVRLGPSDILFPVPPALIVSGSGDSANIMTCAWIGIVSSSPPTLAVSLHSDRHTLKLIRESGDFSVNIPMASQFKQVDYCGLVSGKKRNKFADAGFTPVASSTIQTPIIAECPYNIECKVCLEIELDRWIVIHGEILQTHVDADKIDADNRLDMAKIDPLVYCATVRQYWSMGHMLGKGFDAGKDLIKD